MGKQDTASDLKTEVNYDHQAIEKKWQREWGKKNNFLAEDFSAKEKKYILVEFPYPSGAGLHVGHVWGYTMGDVMARYYRMKGKNVLFPMGWDAFGLPAENYAIKTGISPKVATEQNVNTFKQQMLRMGFSFDWSRGIDTTDPDYYKWTQWIFLQFFKRGLAYKSEIPINWCPFCKSGLAHEEVTAENTHERCGNKVSKRMMDQWLLKITAYADRLIKDLESVDYSEEIKQQQINWIGRSEGAKVEFRIQNSEDPPSPPLGKGGMGGVKVFTTRPDTLFGATGLVLAPEHQLISNIKYQISNIKEVEDYIKRAQEKSELERVDLDKEKTGVKLEGVIGINPANGEEIPVWVADYVVGWYGWGALMLVPAHDERDFEFAKKFGLEIKPVVSPQREYVDENAEAYYSKRTEIHRKLLSEILMRAKADNRKVILQGGWAASVHAGNVYREHDDLDLFMFEEDLAWIKKQLESLGLQIKNMYPEGKNNDYYFQGLNDDVWIDVGGIKLNEDGRVVYLEDNPYEVSEYTFNEHFKESEFDSLPVWVVNKGVLREMKQQCAKSKGLGDLRWKEKADFLMMKQDPYIGNGQLINSGDWNGWRYPEDLDKVIGWLETKGIGKKQVNYKLRDWIFSRQHYWGEPIPVIHCAKCGAVAVPDDQLPVRLPEIDDYEPTEDGKSPLAKAKEWVKTVCPQCGGSAERETDTMPNWAGSSWYFLRYCDPKNNKVFVDKKKLEYFMPVDLYIGGAEHTTLHLLYSRFWHKFLYDLKLVNTPEPYARRRNRGIILGADGRKMSKSLGNVINPDDEVKQFGADTLRIYELFIGPYQGVFPWDPRAEKGVYRFLEKVWNLYILKIKNPAKGAGRQKSKIQIKNKKGFEQSNLESEASHLKLVRKLQQTIKKVGEDIENLKFNTAIAAMMELVNMWQDVVGAIGSVAQERASHRLAPTGLDIEDAKKFLLILAPFAPHMAEELWQAVGATGSVARKRASRRLAPTDDAKRWSIHQQSWPEYDGSLLVEDEVELPVQINGKLRFTVKVKSEKSKVKSEVEELVMVDERVKKWIGGKDIKKIIFVPGKLINLVVG